MSLNTNNSVDSSIRLISERSVQQIVAGQAITDLTSAVKELVDNALDAGARSVTIRLVSYGGHNSPGLDEIEVSDDGSGVSVSDRPLLATKHATSKLTSIGQLYTSAQQQGRSSSDDSCCKTLGFRGEALFSLASLCQSFYITTRCENELVGQKLYYDHSGNLCPSLTQNVPRKVGTSVFAIQLFDTLPVRRLDLIKRAKAHRLKLFKLLSSYAILCTGIQFCVVDVVTTDPTIIAGEDSNNVSAGAGDAADPARKKRKHANKMDVKLVTGANNTTFESTVSSVLGCTMLEGMVRIPLVKGDVLLFNDRQPVETQSSSPGPATCTSTMSLTNNNVKSPQQFSSEYWTMEGLVSYAPGAAPGGAIARELQLLSINGRPVEMLSSLSRAMNDTWRHLFPTAGKRPACVLALRVPPHWIDVNVSPDKREVILVHEEDVRGSFQTTLIDLWSKQVGGIFMSHQASSSSNLGGEAERLHQRQIQQKSTETVKTFSSSSSLPMTVTQLSPNAQTMIRGGSISQIMTNHPPYPMAAAPLIGNSSQKNNSYSFQSIPSSPYEEYRLESMPTSCTPSNRRKMPRRNAFLHDFANTSTAQPDVSMDICSEAERPDRLQGTGALNSDSNNGFGEPGFPDVVSRVLINEIEDESHGAASKTPTLSFVALSEHSTADNTSNQVSAAKEPWDQEKVERSSTPRSDSREVEVPLPENEYEESSHRQQRGKTITWSAFEGNDSILRQYKAARNRMKSTYSELSAYSTDNSSSSGVNSDTIDPKVAATEVGNSVGVPDDDFSFGSKRKKEPQNITLTKDEFTHLNIVGQFNFGFILAICRNFHLWILDQHACDEKFNFEHLIKNTVLQEQKLLKPLALELSLSEEHCILENMNEFEKNGFRFIYNAEKPPRHRFSLTAIPHSGSGGDGKKAVQFGKDDVVALCSILGADDFSDCDPEWKGGESGKYGNNAVRRYGTGQSFPIPPSQQFSTGGISGQKLARLPKAIAMFASRACRSSIMIGDPLSINQMEALVRKMRNVDNPWDCAHGRPTVRHVKDLRSILYEEEISAAQFVASSCLDILSQIDSDI